MADALAEIAPAGVTIGARRISLADWESLAPAERLLTESMRSARRAEFSTGRRLLHDLLGSDTPILIGDRGEPVVPPEVVASLAHDREYAIGAVAHRDAVDAIGIDLEPTAGHPLTSDEAALILRPDDVVPSALAAFVMKEAAYKAWSISGGHLLEHHEMHIACADDAFVATVRPHEPPADRATPHHFIGRLARTAQHQVALAHTTGLR